jgi:tetratricopeptide (TPR) repeat protein
LHKGARARKDTTCQCFEASSVFVRIVHQVLEVSSTLFCLLEHALLCPEAGSAPKLLDPAFCVSHFVGKSPMRAMCMFQAVIGNCPLVGGTDQRVRHFRSASTTDLRDGPSIDPSVQVAELGESLLCRGHTLQGPVSMLAGLVTCRLSSGQIIERRFKSLAWIARVLDDRYLRCYECPARDVFAVQDEVTGCIVGVLVAQLTKAERGRILRKPPESWQAYDLYLRATDRSRQWDREAFLAGERWLEQAVALDPSFAPAYALLADCHMSAWIEPKDHRYQDHAMLDAAWRLAQAAMERDPLLPAAHAAFGNILHWRGEADEAIRAYERALQLNPNSAQFFYGHVLAIAGRPLDGLGALQRSMRLDPFFHPMALGHLGHCYIMLDSDRAALAPLRECAARAPRWRPAFVWLAAACMRLNLVNEARAAAARVLEIEPNFSIEAWRRLHPYRDLTGAERIYGALRAAGLPDQSSTSIRRD